jgi:hypothetical protein
VPYFPPAALVLEGDQKVTLARVAAQDRKTSCCLSGVLARPLLPARSADHVQGVNFPREVVPRGVRLGNRTIGTDLPYPAAGPTGCRHIPPGKPSIWGATAHAT